MTENSNASTKLNAENHLLLVGPIPTAEGAVAETRGVGSISPESTFGTTTAELQEVSDSYRS